jgi:hypothetical protein
LQTKPSSRRPSKAPPMPPGVAKAASKPIRKVAQRDLGASMATQTQADAPTSLRGTSYFEQRQVVVSFTYLDVFSRRNASNE